MIGYWDKPILTTPQLKRLDKHKYSSDSSSLIDPFMQKWWNTVVSWTPMWVAPNLITMVGLIVNVFTSLLVIYFCPTATEPAPRWVAFLCGLGLFIYQTLDAIDGKQARRTGTSSPLGELFDHGCDSVSTVFVSIASACTTNLGLYPKVLLFQCFTASALFYVAHWQTYVTGTMRFGNVDVTEGQMCIIAIMMLTALWGPSFWDIKLLGLLEMRFVPTIVGVVAGGVSLIMAVEKIGTGGAGKNGSTVAGTSVITPIIPLLLVVCSAVTIAAKSSDYVFWEQPILFTITFGLIATKITNRLIIAHMSKSEIGNMDYTTLVPLAFFINHYITGISEHFLLWIAAVFVVIDLFLYCKQVCLEICTHMKVELFRIRPQPAK